MSVILIGERPDHSCRGKLERLGADAAEMAMAGSIVKDLDVTCSADNERSFSGKPERFSGAPRESFFIFVANLI